MRHKCQRETRNGRILIGFLVCSDSVTIYFFFKYVNVDMIQMNNWKK